jgi:hypothetical protein
MPALSEPGRDLLHLRPLWGFGPVLLPIFELIVNAIGCVLLLLGCAAMTAALVLSIVAHLMTTAAVIHKIGDFCASSVCLDLWESLSARPSEGMTPILIILPGLAVLVLTAVSTLVLHWEDSLGADSTGFLPSLEELADLHPVALPTRLCILSGPMFNAHMRRRARHATGRACEMS